MWNVTDETHLPISLQSIQRQKHILQYHRIDHLNISVAINYLCQDGDSDGGWNAEVHNTAPCIMILNDQISDTSLLRLYSYKEIPSLLSAGFEWAARTRQARSLFPISVISISGSKCFFFCFFFGRAPSRWNLLRITPPCIWKHTQGILYIPDPQARHIMHLLKVFL